MLSSRGDYTDECISLPPRMQAWLKGEGVSRAWRVTGEAVGLRGKAFKSRVGMSLERDAEEFQHMTTKFRYFTCVQVPVPTCRRADGMAGLWRPLRAAGEAEGVKPGTPGKESKPGKAPLPGPCSPPPSLENAEQLLSDPLNLFIKYNRTHLYCTKRKWVFIKSWYYCGVGKVDRDILQGWNGGACTWTLSFFVIVTSGKLIGKCYLSVLSCCHSQVGEMRSINYT